MDKGLEKAKDSLNIDTVNMLNFNVDLDKDYDIQKMVDDELDTLGMGGVQEVRGNKITSQEDENECSWSYVFTYFVALKLVPKNSEEDSPSTLEIRASYVVTYLSTTQVEEECLRAFAFNNVGYHVWPYWREFVGSCCSRLGVPIITVPFYIMTKPVDPEPESN